MTAARTLTVAQAKAFYDRFGRKQDKQGFYEDAALDDLLRNGAFESARSLFELGCGTGRLAERILRTRLNGQATYEGVDVSSTMIEIARARLEPFGPRAIVRQVGGDDPFEGMQGRPDRIVTTYVLDLLPPEAIAAFLERASRVLEPQGRLCIAGITFGRGPFARFVMSAWHALFRLSPRIVGGCRPTRLLPLLGGWDVVHHSIVESFGVASEVVVAVPTARLS